MMGTCISWWCNAHISFINHKLIDTWYRLFAYLLKGEQRFKVGELIRAFCIIILPWYSSDLPCYLHFIKPCSTLFRWFLGLSYKVPTLREKISCFCILLFQGPPAAQKASRFLQHNYFITRITWRGGSTREEPWGPNGHRWRDHWSGCTTIARLPLECHLISIFLWMPLYRNKIYAIFSLYFWGGGGVGILLPPP
jgi:hypothetical protein